MSQEVKSLSVNNLIGRTSVSVFKSPGLQNAGVINWCPEEISGDKNPFLGMSQDQIQKLDAVLSSEQAKRILSESSAQFGLQEPKLDEVLENVNNKGPMASEFDPIEESLNYIMAVSELEPKSDDFLQVFDNSNEAISGSCSSGLPKDILEDDLIPMFGQSYLENIILLDHCYSMLPLPEVPVKEEEIVIAEHIDVVVDAEEPQDTEAAEDINDDTEEEKKIKAKASEKNGHSQQSPVRRSQRQIEKIEREQLEKIKAENAEMQRREREEMERMKQIQQNAFDSNSTDGGLGTLKLQLDDSFGEETEEKDPAPSAAVEHTTTEEEKTEDVTPAVRGKGRGRGRGRGKALKSDEPKSVGRGRGRAQKDGEKREPARLKGIRRPKGKSLDSADLKLGDEKENASFASVDTEEEGAKSSPMRTRAKRKKSKSESKATGNKKNKMYLSEADDEADESQSEMKQSHDDLSLLLTSTGDKVTQIKLISASELETKKDELINLIEDSTQIDLKETIDEKELTEPEKRDDVDDDHNVEDEENDAEDGDDEDDAETILDALASGKSISVSEKTSTGKRFPIKRKVKSLTSTPVVNKRTGKTTKEKRLLNKRNRKETNVKKMRVQKLKNENLKKKRKKTASDEEVTLNKDDEPKPKKPAKETIRKTYPKRENRKPPQHLMQIFEPALFSTPDIMKKVELKTPDSTDKVEMKFDDSLLSSQAISDPLISSTDKLGQEKLAESASNVVEGSEAITNEVAQMQDDSSRTASSGDPSENQKVTSSVAKEEMPKPEGNNEINVTPTNPNKKGSKKQVRRLRLSKKRPTKNKESVEQNENVSEASDISYSDDPGDSDWCSEDDPDRLWCICKQPHNDRFMILCDTCEEWFHGKCVGISRTLGREMEKNGQEWSCPKCAKEKLKPKEEKPDVKVTVEKPTVKPVENVKIKATAEPRVQEKKDEKKTAPAKPIKNQSPRERPVTKQCIVKCGKLSRPDSIYCSNECIQKHANESLRLLHKLGQMKMGDVRKNDSERVVVMERRSGRILTGPNAPTKSSLQTWLREHSTFEVLQPNVALPSSKFYNASEKEKKEIPTKITQTLQHPQQQQQPQPQSQQQPQQQQPPPPEKTPKKSTSVSGSEPTRSGPEPIRLNVRKTLREIFVSRNKGADDILLSLDEIKKIVLSIEEELFKLFGDTGSKYKAKYRSLMFNIKDPKNHGLFRKILRGKIPPPKLVRMTHDELASKELAMWRERETKHALEIITRDAVEVQPMPIIKKTHKGDIEIREEDLLFTEDLEEKQKPKVELPVETIIGGMLIDTTEEHRSHLFDLNCKICTGQIAPPPTSEEPPPKKAKVGKSVDHKRKSSHDSKDDHRHSKEKGHKKTEKTKPKKSHSDKKGHVEKKVQIEKRVQIDKRVKIEKKPHSDKKAHTGKKIQFEKKVHIQEKPSIEKKSHTDKTSAEKKVQLEHPVKKETMKNIVSAVEPNQKEASDGEPTSTVLISSPDSEMPTQSDADALATKNALPSVWKGFIVMQDVAKLVAGAFKVSGPTDFLAQDVPDTIQICGRINSSVVWDYLKKVKQSGTKEFLVIRFQPANDEEKTAYVSLYHYLSSRKRFGVVGNASKMVKDFYIVPLASHSPVPATLEPFEGLEEPRPHMLLGVIVRHKGQRKSAVGSSTGSSDTSAATKTLKSRQGSVDKIEIPEPSFTPPLETFPKAKSSTMTKPSSMKKDDGSYTPPLRNLPSQIKSVLNIPAAESSDRSYTPPLEHLPHAIQKHDGDSPYDPEIELLDHDDDDDAPYDPEDDERDLVDENSSSVSQPILPILSGPVSTQSVSELIDQISKSSNPAVVTTTVLASIATATDLEQQRRLLIELTQKVEEQKRQLEMQKQRIAATVGLSLKSGKEKTPREKASSPPPPPPPPPPPAPVPAPNPNDDEAYSPSYTPPLEMESSSSFSSKAGTEKMILELADNSNISLPANLQKILENIKNKVNENASESSFDKMANNNSQSSKAAILEDPIVRNFATVDEPEEEIKIITPPKVTPVEEVTEEDASLPEAPSSKKTVDPRMKGASKLSDPRLKSQPPQDPRRKSGGGALSNMSVSELVEKARKELELEETKSSETESSLGTISSIPTIVSQQSFTGLETTAKQGSYLEPLPPGVEEPEVDSGTQYVPSMLPPGVPMVPQPSSFPSPVTLPPPCAYPPNLNFGPPAYGPPIPPSNNYQNYPASGYSGFQRCPPYGDQSQLGDRGHMRPPFPPRGRGRGSWHFNRDRDRQWHSRQNDDDSRWHRDHDSRRAKDQDERDRYRDRDDRRRDRDERHREHRDRDDRPRSRDKDYRDRDKDRDRKDRSRHRD